MGRGHGVVLQTLEGHSDYLGAGARIFNGNHKDDYSNVTVACKIGFTHKLSVRILAPLRPLPRTLQVDSGVG